MREDEAMDMVLDAQPAECRQKPCKLHAPDRSCPWVECCSELSSSPVIHKLQSHKASLLRRTETLTCDESRQASRVKNRQVRKADKGLFSGTKQRHAKTLQHESTHCRYTMATGLNTIHTSPPSLNLKPLLDLLQEVHCHSRHWALACSSPTSRQLSLRQPPVL